MKLQALVLMITIWTCYGCDSKKGVEEWSKEEMNTILSNIDLADPAYTVKDLKFDSILTIAGTRSLGDTKERIKCKLFFFGENMRGYFNLADQDDKNLQIFGKHVDDYIALKCATKINMKESDGYLILDKKYNGVWSNGSINFQKGKISMTKQKIDYTSLKAW